MMLLGREIGFVYMIKITDFDRYGRINKSYLYVGSTNRRIDQRYVEHLYKHKSYYMKKWHPNSDKSLVYVEIVKPRPNGWKYHPREYELKFRYSKYDKINEIKSNRNMLKKVSYIFPYQHPVIKLKNGITFVWGRPIKIDENKLEVIKMQIDKILKGEQIR